MVYGSARGPRVRNRLLMPAVLLALLSTSLAGCLGGDDAPKATGLAEGQTTDAAIEEPGSRDGLGLETPALFGFVTDLSRNPLPGVFVEIQNEPFNTTTDERGAYVFEGLPANTTLVLLARGEGFKTQAQQVASVSNETVQLDFLLDAQPVLTPYSQMFETTAFIACQFTAEGDSHGSGGEGIHQDCGGQDTNNRNVLEFRFDPGLVGIVVDVRWEPVTELARFVHVDLETVGYGDLDRSLGGTIGPSILTLSVSQEAIKKYYTGNGGLFRVHLEASPEDDDEQPLGAALHLQQTLDVVVTGFYHGPNPPEYTGFPDE